MSHLRKIATDLGKSKIKQDKVLMRLILVAWFVFWIGMWWVSEHSSV